MARTVSSAFRSNLGRQRPIGRPERADPAVSQCAVVGLPDTRWGERVHAVIVANQAPQADADEIIAYMRTKLAAYKCPRSVEFRREMPLSAAGKILKAELRG